MKSVRLVFVTLGAVAMWIAPAPGQKLELPEGPNREVVSRECQACHDLSMVIASTGMSRNGWDSIIDEMVSYGMNVTPEERAKILDYLANNLGPR